MQQVTGSSKPAEERGDGEAIDSGEAPRAAMRACAVVDLCRVTDVDVSYMQMRKAANCRDQAEYETNAETDEVEGVHIIECDV